MKKRLLLGAICLFLLASAPRLISLDAHWSSDEARWLNRSAKFISAVREGAFSKTGIAYHPGVTTMWIAGLRTFFTPPRVDIENLASARWFIGLVVSASIVLSIFFVYQMFGRWVALSCFACLAYSPLFLAQARRVHTDALATVFILLTVLQFLRYCQNRQHRRYLIFSGIAFGLALLSKSYALILLIWVPLCLFLFGSNRESRGRWHRFLMYITEVVAFLNCAILAVLALWPVFWTPIFGIMALCLFVFTSVLLKGNLENKQRRIMWLVALGIGQIFVCVRRAVQTVWIVFDKVKWAVTTPHEVEHFFLGKVVNDPDWLFYPFVLTIKSTPLMLPLAIVGCILLWKQRNDSAETAHKFRMGLSLVAAILLFTVCLSATSKKFPRYLLPAFAMLEILAAIGLVEGIKWGYTALRSRFGIEATAKYKTSLTVFACVVFFFLQVIPVLARHPYYGTYYNLCWKLTRAESDPNSLE